MDDRGQAIGISRFFLALGVGAVVIWIVNAVTTPLFTHVNGRTETGEAAATGTQYLQTGVDFLPIAMLGISFFGLIAYSVYSREVLR